MKSFASALLIFFALATPLLGFDEVIRIEPAHPTSTDRIRVTVSGTWRSGCTPRYDSFGFGDGVVILRFSATDTKIPCTANTPPWSHTVAIGPLHAGTWELQARIDGDVVAKATFTVTDAGRAFEIIPSSSRVEGGIPVRLRPGFNECSITSCQEYRVLFDGVAATVSDELGAQVIPPPHAPGRVDVTIHTTEGETITRKDAFLYYDHAEGPPEEAFERILIPLMFEGEGAFASHWTSALTVRNRSDAGIEPWNSIVRCDPGERCRPQIPAGATLHLTPSSLGSWMHGYLFAVPREQADDLDFSLHIRDLSRQAESFGTEIPVVREKELPRSPVTLLDVPLDSRFRRMLRIYDLSAVDGSRVAMRWRLDDGTQVGADQHLFLGTLIRCVTTPCWFPEPAGLAMPLFDAALPPNVTQDHLHVEIEPLTPDSRIWAFVTVTNNETQQVTTITPQ